MTTDAKRTLTPKLRFPQFREAVGWRVDVLAAVCGMQAGKFVSASDIAERNEKGSFPCYGGNGLRGYTLTYTHEGTYPLIGRQGALCGNVRLVQGRFHATEHAVVVTPNEAIDVCWLYYSLDILNLNRFATGQAQPGLSVDVLKTVPLAIPEQEAEQQKIAGCLTSLGELIGAQARTVDALKAHRKGLMQQLFPPEGETQPRLRFPEFQAAGDWGEVDFSDAISFQEGPGIMAVDFRDSGVPLIRLSGLGRQIVSLDGCNYLDSDKVQQKWSHFRLDAGDLLVSCSASFGRPAVVTDIAAGAVFYTGLVRFRPKNGRIAVDFLEVFLGSPSFLRQAASHAVGSGIKHFGPSHLRQMKVPLPCLAEQQRIADCFTSLDGLIVAQTQKLDALQTHKSGLTQQLFPSPEEVDA